MTVSNISDFLGLKLIDLSDDTQVNSGGGQDNQFLQPNAGFIYQIISIRYYAPDPSGSTSGTHTIDIYHNDTSSEFTKDTHYLKAIANTGSNIVIDNHALTGDSSETPSGAEQQFGMINGCIWVDNANKLTLSYSNGTDANQTATRALNVWVKVYKEVI